MISEKRHSIRLRHYDYAGLGIYFVTLCAHNRKCLFGEIADGKMILNKCGGIVRSCWKSIPDHFPHAKLDEYVVMPNHLHGIIVVGARHAVPLRVNFEQFGKPVSGSIPTVLRSFKSAVTKQINSLREISAASVWQRNYYERVIRNESELDRLREYIRNNPRRWQEDENNPANL